jgi:hypothetical protein
MRKQLEKKGVFKKDEKYELEKLPELPMKAMADIGNFSPTIYGYQAWEQKHEGTLSQFMDLATDDAGIKQDINRLVKKMDRMQLLITLEFVYSLIYPKSEKEEKEERDV